jgi:hypothetical protein
VEEASVTIYIVLIGTAFLLAAFYPLRWAPSKPWHSNFVGRAAFTWSVILAVVFGLTLASALGVNFPRWFGVVIYLAIIGGLLYQDITLDRALRRRHNVSDETEKV